MPDGVRDRRRQRDVVGLVGQVLGEEPPVRAVAEVRPDVGVVAGAPDLLAGAARERRVDRAAGRGEAPAGTADEAALLVGLVELERLDEVAELALPAHQRVLEQARRRWRRDASSAACRRGRTSWPARRGGPARPTAAAAAACRSRWPRRPRPSPARSARRRRGRSRSRRSPGPSRRSRCGGPGRRSRAARPLAMALGQWVRSVEALAPSLQPDWQVLRWTHGRRPS